jgi:membrane fusion protein (multidrug efflux system)
MFRSSVMLIAIIVFVSACSPQKESGMAGPPGAGGPGRSGPVEVGVITMTAAPVPQTAELSGRVVASATAEIRPQVNGIVRSIDFQEGRPVKVGAVLFTLDDRSFAAARTASAAALAKAKATAAGAQTTFDRQQRLASSNAVSQQTLDEAQTALLQANADVEAAQADLQTAQINLENTRISAPIDGFIGTAAVSVGSLVTQNQTDAMTTIRRIDPVNVDLVDTSANLLRIREQIAEGKLGRPDGSPPAARLTLENGAPYETAGTVSIFTVNVSESTGTFTLRAVFPNPDGVLLPGMFVRASVDLGQIPDAFLVPQRAVQRDAGGGAIAYVASADGKAEQRTLVTNGVRGNDWIVTGGLAAGDRLIVDGFQKFSAGAEITAVAATIDADGVVEQTLRPATAPAGMDVPK